MQTLDLFSRLALGELSNIAIGESGEIAAKDRPRVLTLTNTVLTSFFSRFVCRRDYVTLRVTPEITRYELKKIHNDSDTDVLNTAARYIVDSVDDPFLEDVVNILALIDEDGEPVPLDHLGGDDLVRRLSYNTLRIEPEADTFDEEASQLWEFEYQARHPLLAVHVDDQEIDLPPILEDALVSKVASLLFSGMTGEAHVGMSQMLNARCEEMLATAEMNGLLLGSQTFESPRMMDAGFI